MRKPARSNPIDERKQRVLLIGDAGSALSGTDRLNSSGWQFCDKMIDGIALAANQHFDVILVVMAGLPGKLASALKTLKHVSGGAKVILLAQMQEEPLALHLVHSGNGVGLANDYMICPVRQKEITDSFFKGDRGLAKAGSAAAELDENDETIKELIRLATEDELTGTKNRRYVREFLRQVLEQAGKDNSKVTVLIFDIDDFKHYNDAYGHSTGDKILKQAAILMQRCCRSHDVVGRIGGDEFAVIFWEGPRGPSTEAERRAEQSDHPREAIFITERFRKEFNSTELSLLGPQGKGVLTISGGLASFPRDGGTADELFEQADKALLEAKRSGKNRIYLVGKPENEVVSEEQSDL